MDKITDEQLKNYCKHILDAYIPINPKYEDSKIYHQLIEFYEYECVKDIIYKNTKKEIIAEWLGNIATKINIFYSVHDQYIRKIKIEKIRSNL